MQSFTRVLFLCRLNWARSIMAEAILNSLAEGRLRAASASGCPCRYVNPYALECLETHGVATANLHSKGWSELSDRETLSQSILITLCETERNVIANIHCGICAHWSIPDPAAVFGSPLEIRSAFEDAFSALDDRIRQLLALPLERLSERALSQELARLSGGGYRKQ